MAGDPAEIELVDRQKVSGVSAEIELVKPRRVFSGVFAEIELVKPRRD